jgi:hypothetical protein
MKIIINESQYKTILKEFMGSIESSKFMKIFKKFLDDKNIVILYDNESMFKTHISIKLPKTNSDDYLIIFSEIEKFIEIYGWFISSYIIGYNNYEDISFLSYEKLVDWIKTNESNIELNHVTLNLEKKYTEQNKNHNVFYHVTDKKNTEKIMTYGLRPRKSQNKYFNYSDRIYLANHVKVAYYINNLFKNPKAKTDYGKEGVVVFEITLPDSFKTYFDPQAPASSYTLEPIPPKYIEIYDYLD